MWNPLHPRPAPPGFGEGKEVPIGEASWISRLLFGWLGPFLKVGFSRPLQKDDLWQLPPERLTDALTDVVEREFYARCSPDKRPRFLRQAETNKNDRPISEQSTRIVTVEDEKSISDTEPVIDEKKDVDVEANTTPIEELSQGTETSDTGHKYDESLLKALHNAYFSLWWTAGFLTLIGTMLNTTSPLVNQVILTWLEDVYIYWKLPESERVVIDKPKGIGYGIGLAFALFVMQEASSLMTCHYSLKSMEVGMLMRTSIIGTIFRKSLRLSARARLEHSVGKITTMISTDATRLEKNTYYAHNLWIAPLQIIIGVALLLKTLGYSGLVGVGVMILGLPAELICVFALFKQRSMGVVLTDKRVRTISEVLSGIRLIKFFSWEGFFAHEVSTIRQKEVHRVRLMGLALASLISVVTMIPVLAAVLSFITYALSGHTLNVSIIFTSLQFFNIIRMPLITLPMVLAHATDSVVALKRISKFLLAEELIEPYTIEPSNKYAIDVEGDFTWDTAHKPAEEKISDLNANAWKRRPERPPPPKKTERRSRCLGKRKKNPRDNKGELGQAPQEGSASAAEDGEKNEKPFELKDFNFKVPRGSFVAVLGPIGSGKSSLLQALIGEMRRVSGHATFSSQIAYVPQTPWIINASLRQNITFGQPNDDQRFREVVRACCLERDLEMLPQGENTEIGERGINLSGGQKARVSLARAAYSGADIVLMDDALSAVDAHTGKRILEDCFMNGPLGLKTRVLLTHALHLVVKTDYIYIMDNGAIVEQGTFSDLMKSSTRFARMMEEYGNLDKIEEEDDVGVQAAHSLTAYSGKGKKDDGPGLMQVEERLTGAVSWKTYNTYFRYAGGVFWLPLIGTLLCLTQGASVANNIMLGFWTAESVAGFTQSDYMATYATLGVANALFSFFLSFAITLASLYAGLRMFEKAWNSVLHSPVSFFDTTPMGRILSRLSKDQDTIDAELSMTTYQFMSSLSSVVGTVFLVFYTFPYLGIMFVPLTIAYYLSALYYRRSSVETKRLDSILRSWLYAAYAETLTGLSTVRAFGEESHFVRKTEKGLDLENRAYYMVIAIQQWLATRLDLLGNLLVLGIALFAAGYSKSINPSKVGVVISYTLSITSTFSQLVSTYAQNEQNFNCVERILHYADLPSEGNATTPNDPPPSWPEKGHVEFKDVELAYRPGLPVVLKRVSFTVNSGEKVGIVGRTGAGKSSLMQALFRIVEVQGGKIEIDGVNISDIGLATLRSRMALVPQDNVLFRGTLRQNLDPAGSRPDAEMIAILQKAWLLPRDGQHDPVAEAKFSLDSTVDDEGSNYSAGEKQLLALARALVKNSRIIVLDEATSNVDLQNDAKIQQTIQTEFSSSTLLCVAHRLNTIVYYDRVLVMDAGQVVEYDTPLNLYDKEDSIFRSLCDEARLARQDIVRIRANVPTAGHTDINDL
ncbi:multidrug resistance-associated ABC transporter [Laetiporus sulphureus 93-53]|uniref:Multidrug resistance-associated ABC transporter n=1 Tax=Laetiporus sulphureus 93-53 TaxID=1314785 RepID=A0A165CWQ5_9APHY|nr:multidrug resistance-associated ABC transporter [Laetiporus sulphureus 93-53]KZT03607.1 multidrug resistance-associated ABC transporter [Laetiporus sulphureus 93-53]